MTRSAGLSRRSALVAGVAVLAAAGGALGVSLDGGTSGLNFSEWDTATEGPLAVAFSPDSLTLYCGTPEGIQVWNTSTGRIESSISTTSPVGAVAASPDGRFLGGVAGDIKVWSPGTRELVGTFSAGANANALDIAFDPVGDLLAAGCIDGTVRLLSVSAGQAAPPQVLRGHSGNVNGVAFSPDGRMLVSGGADGTARVWDIPAGRLPRVLQVGHGASSVAFDPKGRKVAAAGISGAGGGVVRIWDASTGARVADFVGTTDDTGELAFSPNGELLVSGGATKVNVWDLAKGRVSRSSPISDVSDVAAVSPDGRTLAVGRSDGKISVSRTL